MSCRQFKDVVLIICFAFTAVTAQQLKPTEIIYSRMPTNPNAPPTGSNQPTIWAVGQDGSNDRFITNGTLPRISDDGRFLLFKRFTRAPSFYDPFGGYADFYVRELATGQETLARSLNFDNYSTTLSYTPESNQGVWEIVTSMSCLIHKFNLDGSNLFRFPWVPASYCSDDFPSVRRGDQLISFSDRTVTPNAGGLYTVGIDGSNRQKIPNTTCADFAPAWSNDNQFLAAGIIVQNCNANLPQVSLYPYWVANIFKIKPDGSGRQQLTGFPSNPDCSNPNADCLTLGYVWTEDNSKIIFAGRINGVKGLFTVPANGGVIQQIPISAGNAPEYVGGIVQPRVDRNVVSIGGGVTSSGNYTLVSTIGEPIAGITSQGGNYTFESGFWAISADVRKSPFDFDGDSKTDISIFRPSVGQWWYLKSSNNGNAAFNFGQSTDKLAPGDFTGDGKADICFFRPSDGSWYVLRSEDFSFFSFPFGAAGDIPAPADYDGDGKTDPAVFRPSTQTWFINRSTAGLLIVNFGFMEDKPIPSDFDGDGKADLAVFRPSVGQWWYLRSSDGGNRAYQFGLSTDRPVVGDYTGDGKSDIAFWRPSDGFWYILRSEDDSFFSFPFGSTGDIPAPGDYDGDGKFDPTVFRPSSATWFINRSTAGLLIVGFGFSEDRPVPSAFVP